MGIQQEDAEVHPMLAETEGYSGPHLVDESLLWCDFLILCLLCVLLFSHDAFWKSYDTPVGRGGG